MIRKNKKYKKNLNDCECIYNYYLVLIVLMLALIVLPIVIIIINNINKENIVFIDIIKDDIFKSYYTSFCSILVSIFVGYVTILVNKNNMELSKEQFILKERNDCFPFIDIKCIYVKNNNYIEMKLKNVSDNIANNIKILSLKNMKSIICDALYGLCESSIKLTYENNDKLKEKPYLINERKSPKNRYKLPSILEIEYQDQLGNKIKVKYIYKNKIYIIEDRIYT